MPFHHDQKLTLPEKGDFRLKRWDIEHPEKKDHWHKCNPGDCVAVLEKEGRQFEVKILFPAVIARLFRKEGESISEDTFFLQWLADGENIPRTGPYFAIQETDFQQIVDGNAVKPLGDERSQ